VWRWHSGGGNVTRHYSAAQVRELREALELIKTEPAEGANKTPRTLADEARESKTKGKTEPTTTKLHAGARKRKRACELPLLSPLIYCSIWRARQDSNPRPLGS